MTITRQQLQEIERRINDAITEDTIQTPSERIISSIEQAIIQEIDNNPVLQRVEDAITIEPEEEVLVAEDSITPFEEVIIEQDSYTIPVNINVIRDDTTSRFSSAVWFEAISQKRVLLAGLGGIGSYVGFLLSRVKPLKITIYDNDIVEMGNLSGQLYSSNDVNNTKTTALANMMTSYSNYRSIVGYNQKFVLGCVPQDIMICGFDNMVARKEFYLSWKQHVSSKNTAEEQAKCLFIDGRLAAEEFQIFCMTGVDDYYMDQYQNEWLFKDEEAEQTLCSFKQTSHIATMIASVMVNLFTNFVAIECGDVRDLPFLTEYNANMMFFNTVK